MFSQRRKERKDVMCFLYREIILFYSTSIASLVALREKISASRFSLAEASHYNLKDII